MFVIKFCVRSPFGSNCWSMEELVVVGDGCVDMIPFLSWVIWPLEVAILGGKYFRIVLRERPGKESRKPCLMAFSSVERVGLNNDA